jgi:hypothetical protein
LPARVSTHHPLFPRLYNDYGNAFPGPFIVDTVLREESQEAGSKEERSERKEALVLATWDIRSKIRGERAMWKTLPVLWIKRKRHG